MSIDLKTRRISKSNTIGSKFDLFRKTLDYDESVKSSDDENDNFDVECQNYVFEVGVPKVLRHLPESKLVLAKVDSPDNTPRKFFELEIKDLLIGGMICEFCQSVAQKWSTIHEAYCCNDFKEYVQGLIDCQKHTDSLRENLRFDYKTSSFVTKVHKTSQIFKRKLNQINRFYFNIPQKKIPISYSKKAEFKKEINISKNLNEIEEKFQQLLTDKQVDTISIDSYNSQDTKAKSRISYLLSNIKYVDRGWTIVNNDHESNLYVKKRLELKDQILTEPNSIDIWSSHVTNPIIKNYKNGKTFQIIHADRSGNIYYPNGRLALLICNSGNYRSFIAFSTDEIPVTLASFDSEGNAFCNYNTGQLRYHINSNGGINFDQSGNCIRKWLFPEDSTKLLTFHPIRFSINEFMSVQIHNKFKIIFQFRSRHAACKFLIKLNHTNFEDSTEYNEFQVLPNETVCLKLKSRAENLLRLLQMNAQTSTKSTKILKRPSLSNSSDNSNNEISRGTNHSSNANNNNRNNESSLKFPRLKFNLPEHFSNKESYTYSVSKSSFLDNTSSVSNTTRSSNRLNDKNTINNSIVFSLQGSVRS